MVIKTAEIIFNNNQSKFNKDLIDFLKKNINVIIIRAQIKFRFLIVNPDEFDNLKSRGIARLPAMIFQKKNYVSVPDIVEELKNQVSNSKASAQPKTEEEVIQDYFKESLGDIKTDSEGKILVNEMDQEDENNEKRQLENNLARAAEMRKNSLSKKGNSQSNNSYLGDNGGGGSGGGGGRGGGGGSGGMGNVDDMFNDRLLEEASDRPNNIGNDLNVSLMKSKNQDDDLEMMQMMLGKL